METNKPQIYQALATIMAGVSSVSKSRKNVTQNFMFRGIDDVMNELHDLFARNQVFILPELLEFTTENRPTKTGGLQTYTRAKMKYRFMAVDGSFVETVNIGEAMDSADKSMNKAMSIALKYALLQMFLIPTEEKKDPDYDTPEEVPYLDMALQEVRGAQSVDTLNGIYKNYVPLQKDKTFLSALTARKNELQS